MSTVKKIVLALIIIGLSAGLIVSGKNRDVGLKEIAITSKIKHNLTPTITPTKAPTATPTPDIEKLYGPCAKVNVLMFHHIKTAEEVKPENQGSLSVDPAWFKKDMEFIKTKGYTVITPMDLINFFDSGISLPKKSVMITFDDAYNDNYTNMWPILKEYGFKATIFVPTGHVNGIDYLSWDQMGEMGPLVYFANHTWSHHSSVGSIEVLDKELRLADIQLSEHNYNANKVFAYPYGKTSANDESILKKYNYKLAFTTTHGNLMCKGKRFDLPRIRAGNAPLSNYGL